MTQLILYGTSHCHLCDEAKVVIRSFSPFARTVIELVEVDIVDDDELYDELEEKIPVLENADTGQRLYWPFGIPELISLT